MIFLLCLLTVVFVLLMLKLDCDITTWFYEKTGTNLHSFYSNKVVFDLCNFRYFLLTMNFVHTRKLQFPKGCLGDRFQYGNRGCTGCSSCQGKFYILSLGGVYHSLWMIFIVLGYFFLCLLNQTVMISSWKIIKKILQDVWKIMKICLLLVLRVRPSIRFLA